MIFCYFSKMLLQQELLIFNEISSILCLSILNVESCELVKLRIFSWESWVENSSLLLSFDPESTTSLVEETLLLRSYHLSHNSHRVRCRLWKKFTYLIRESERILHAVSSRQHPFLFSELIFFITSNVLISIPWLHVLIYHTFLHEIM